LGSKTALFNTRTHEKKAMVGLTDFQIKALLQSYLKDILEKAEKDAVLGRKSWRDEKTLDDHVDALAYLQHDCQRELAIGNYSRVTGAVDRLLAEKGLNLDRDGLSYKKLCREMMKVMINYLEIEARRTRFDNSLDDLPFPR
jgi:hypothetical protein